MALASLASRRQPGSLEAGLNLLKQGLLWNLKSVRSWHIQGIYYRNDKQYGEALKSYLQVHKLMRQ
eukprot:UN05192